MRVQAETEQRIECRTSSEYLSGARIELFVEELAGKNDGTIDGEVSCSHAHHLYILNHERHSSTKASDITACDAA